MTQRVLPVVAAILVAVGLLVVFGYYLSRGGRTGTETESTDLVGVRTPEIAGELTYPATITDSKDHQLVLERPPKRIIVTSSEAASCIVFLGKGDYVIGRLSHQHQSELAHAKVVSGGSLEANYEAMAGMNPDLILTNLMTYDEKVRMFERYGLPYFAFKIRKIDEMVRMYGLFAKLLDASSDKIRELEELLAKLEEVEERMAGLKPEDRPKVFFEMGYRPSPRTMPSDSIAADIIARAGGRMFPVGRSFNAPVSVESIMDDPPDWYLVSQGFLAGDTTREEVKERPMLGNLSCIQNDRFLLVDSLSYIQSHPRTIENIIQLAKKLHPDRMEGSK
jgi:iron complex transport system substrate-binding protein